MITKDSKRILVADDDELFRVKLGYILNKAEHEVNKDISIFHFYPPN